MTRVLWLVMIVGAVQCSPMSRDELEDFSNFLLKTSSLDLHVKSADPEDALDEDELVSDHAWEESGKFEGDLILNDRQRRLIVENVEGLSRNGLTDSTKRWPNNEVIYFIQREHFSSGQVQAIQDGIDDLARASCVKFRPYTKGDRDAVVIQGSRRGCFSQVGYQGGYQVLNLSGRHPVGRGCFRHGTVVHELLHSLGFYHMQSSPDRDDYINVIWSNIVQPARHNFRKYNSFSVSDFGVGYDYDSVLHYSRRAFSANGQDTLVPKKNGAEIGQRVGLSDKDTQKLNKMYCDADNDQNQADENATQKSKIKKKKPKNQPFEGHGIGYHQGKTVVIKLPAAETYKLPKANVPPTHVFDFSKTPEIVSTPEAEGYRFGKKVIYLYKPTISLNTEAISQHPNQYDESISLIKDTQNLPTVVKIESSIEDKREKTSDSNDPSEVKPEYVPIDSQDKDLKEEFHRLTAIVKQHIYPQNHDNVHKINKDYSKFLKPLPPKKTNPYQGSLDDKFKQPFSYSSPSLAVKQIDAKEDKQHQHMEDRMDSFYGTSLPTKKPYSSYEQTETPHYATLEYLQGRHNFSDVYSPETTDDKNNKHEDDNYSTEREKYEQGNININPYDQGFYTDILENDRHSVKTYSPKDRTYNNEEKLNKYEMAKKSLEERLHSMHKQLDDSIGSSFRTLLPSKKPYSSYDRTDTPTYATLEYLRDRNDISSIYTPKKPVNEKRIEPTKNDWYKDNSYKHNNDNDRYSFSHYKEPKFKEQHKGDVEDDSTDVTNYDYDSHSKNRTKLLTKPETVLDYQDYYTDYEKKEFNERDMDDSSDNDDKTGKSESKQHEENYYPDITNYKKEDISHSEDDVVDKNSPKKNKIQFGTVKRYPDYITNYENSDRLHKEHRGRLLFASNQHTNTDKSGNNQAYTLYGVPVPLTKDWYKPRYSVHDTSQETPFTESHKDDYR